MVKAISPIASALCVGYCPRNLESGQVQTQGLAGNGRHWPYALTTHSSLGQSWHLLTVCVTVTSVNSGQAERDDL